MPSRPGNRSSSRKAAALDRRVAEPLISGRGLLLSAIGVTFIIGAGVYVFLRERFERGPQEAPRPIEQTRTGPFDARSET